MAREERQTQRRTSLRDKARERAVDNKSFGGKSYLRLPEGVDLLTKLEAKTFNWDIVPFEVSVGGMVQDGRFKEVLHKVGELEYVRTIAVHEYMGANEKHYLCPRIVGKPCPFCEERQRLSKLPPPPTAQELKQLESEIAGFKPKVKDLWNLVDRDNPRNKDGSPKVQVLEFSHANFREVLEEELRQGKEEWGGFADLYDAFTVRARFSEETFDTSKFYECSRIDFEPRADYGEDILKHTVDLDTCLIIEPYEKLRAVLYGADGEEIGTTEYRVEKSEPTTGHEARQLEDKRPEPEPKREEPRREPVQEPEPEGSRAERGQRQEPAQSTRTPRQEPVEEPVQQPTQSTRTPRQEPVEEKPAPAGDCPSGHRFGFDCDAKAECAKCPTSKWEPCRDAADAMKK